MLAERLRTTAEQGRPDGRQVTISIGVASSSDNTRTAESLVEKADAALYRAKRSGKNRVEVSAQCERTEVKTGGAAEVIARI